MNVHVFATDYDGTIAERNHVAETTARALARARATGRKVVLVTHLVPRDTNSGGEIGAHGIAGSLAAAGYDVEACYCGKPGVDLSVASFPTADCSAR